MPSEQPVDASDPLAIWSGALPHILALLDPHRRDLFRHELQRFIATSRFDAPGAEASSGALREMLLQAARAARQPAAIHAIRSLDGPPQLAALCEGLLASWLDAIQQAGAAQEQPCDPKGMSGEVFFGPRLGGKGRPTNPAPTLSQVEDSDPGEKP